MSSAITIGDQVRVTVPTSLSGSRVGEVTEIAKFVTESDTRCRYLLKFTGSRVPLWYFDYEVEAEKDQVPFSVGDLVQCRGYALKYEVIAVHPETKMVDVRALDKYATLFRNFPIDIFKLYAEPDEAKCSTCGHTIEHNDQ